MRAVGIDLGTTHTLLAYASLASGEASRAKLLPIPQLVAPGTKGVEQMLPSALYAPTEAEASALGSETWLLGRHAWERAKEVPGRGVISAKSWLAQPHIEGDAKVLPWGAAEDAPRISPIDASVRYLGAVVEAYRASEGGPKGDPLDVVITIPASFDEEARLRTTMAAERAGLRSTLLEEPLAAFYTYLADEALRGTAELATLARTLGRAARVLVVDVGGGTTDLSLLEVRAQGARVDDAVRVATGPHLLLGGDNMDLALAHALEHDLGEDLSPEEFAQLILQARRAKEVLLADAAPDRFVGSLAGRGARLIGRTRTFELTRERARQIVLDGFFPVLVEATAPARAALRALGLPYERELGITAHVARFVAAHAPPEGSASIDAVLLNGGVFHAPACRDALIADLRRKHPNLSVLPHGDLDGAVARGAVYFAEARAGERLRVRLRAPRSYYLATQRAGSQVGVCALPQGATAGEEIVLPQRVTVQRGQAVRFEVHTHDAPGRLGGLSPLEGLHRLPALVARPPGDAATEAEVCVEYTEEGSLRVTLRDDAGDFVLSFRELGQGLSGHRASLPATVHKLAEARIRLQAFGAKATEHRAIVDLVRDLERQLGARQSWDAQDCRELFDVWVEQRGARRRSDAHERVFWQLAGFLLRPGLGVPGDDARVAQLFTLFEQRLAFPDKAVNWQAYLVAMRRVGPGLTDVQAAVVFDTLASFVGLKVQGQKKPKWTPLADTELRGLLASLESAGRSRRRALGDRLVELSYAELSPALCGDLALVGARQPSFGRVDTVLPPEDIEPWIAALLRQPWEGKRFAVELFIALTRLTGDRARDVGISARREVERRLRKAGTSEDRLLPLREVVQEERRATSLGEDLPLGLRLSSDDLAPAVSR
jgi:molecular chaperone DnaK (HSP70)